MLPFGVKCWMTPDDAIREVTTRSPLDSRGIDYERPRVDGRSDDLAELVDAHSRVLAILGQFDEREQGILKAYAHGAGYSAISKAMKEAGYHAPRTSVIRWHNQARDEFVERMKAQGLLCDSAAA